MKKMKKKQIKKFLPSLSKVPSLPNISTFRPKIKKDVSTHNASSTTNFSGEKNLISNNNSSIIDSQNISKNKNNKSILLHKIKLNNSKSQSNISKSWILPESIITRKGSLEIMDYADNILMERIRNHDRDFAFRKKRLKSIERDKKRFISFLDEIREKQEKEELNYIDIKNIRIDAESNLEIEERKRRLLEQMLHRKIKDLYLMKDFGSFVHNILGIDFPFNCLPPLKNDLNPEQIGETFIQIFDSMNNFNDIIKELGNTDCFFNKCNLMENEIIEGISENKILEEEIIQLKKSVEKELKQLKFNRAELESDYNYLINEIRIVKGEMNNYKLNDSEDFDMYLSYIEELGSEIGSSVEKPQKHDKNYLNEFVSYSKGISQIIIKTDDTVNEMISFIENALGDKNDKELMLKIIFEQKNENKREKQMSFKEKEEELKMKQKLKMMEKEKKVVIKGRKVISDYPMTNKHHKFKIKKIHEIKNEGNKNVQMEYSFSEEEEKKNNFE